MKHITGIRKYYYIIKYSFIRQIRTLPPRFLLRIIRLLAAEKLTLSEKHIFFNTHYAPLGHGSYRTVIDNFSRIRSGESRPFSAYISLTDECPFNCRYCSNQKSLRASGIDTNSAIRLVNELHTAGVSCIGFTGGEPLLRSDLEQIIASVDDRSYTILFTSGYSLNATRAKSLKDAGLLIAAVSLDSADRNTFNTRRASTDAFDASTSAIEAFSSAGVYTSATAVVDPGDVSAEKIHALLSLIHSLGASELRILEAFPAGNNAGANGFSENEKLLLEKLRTQTNKDPSLPKLSFLSTIESKMNFGCSAGRYHLYIDAHGNVCPCDFVQTSYGNILDEPFTNAYKRMIQNMPVHSSECLRKRLLSTDAGTTKIQTLKPLHDTVVTPELFRTLKIKSIKGRF